MNEAILIARKWLPNITEKDKDLIVNEINQGFIGPILLDKYMEFILPYMNIIKSSLERNSDCLASGLLFFYGCFCYIIHFQDWGKHIEDIFLYNLLYLLVDHYIDDNKLDNDIKYKSIKQMFILLDTPDINLEDDMLNLISKTYSRLILRCPNTKQYIINLFHAEIEGLKIQNTDSLSRNEYYSICCKKGGLTMQVLDCIVGGNNLDMAYELGIVMQLLDDSIDVISDMNNNINTIATYDIELFGNLDNIWIDIMNRINNINLPFFNLIYTTFAVYLPTKLEKLYSKSLIMNTSPLNLFEKCDGHKLLIQALLEKIV